jgi:hypothetical protein
MVSMDYELLEQNVTLLVVKDETSGATLAYDCEAKGCAKWSGTSKIGAAEISVSSLMESQP